MCVRPQACAEEGSAACASLHAGKVPHAPASKALGQAEIARQVVAWNRRAAEGGDGVSCVKLARAYLKTLPSVTPLFSFPPR